jgi:hypothetical protein
MVDISALLRQVAGLSEEDKAKLRQGEDLIGRIKAVYPSLLRLVEAGKGFPKDFDESQMDFYGVAEALSRIVAAWEPAGSTAKRKQEGASGKPRTPKGEAEAKILACLADGKERDAAEIKEKTGLPNPGSLLSLMAKKNRILKTKRGVYKKNA